MARLEFVISFRRTEMRLFHRIIAQTLVFFVIASCGGAVLSTAAVTVVVRDKPFVVRDPDTGTLCYCLGLAGNELWSRRRMKIQSDVDIGEDIRSTKLLYRSVCIMLVVDNPREGTPEDATVATERLKKIASQHASADYKIEIVVFPRARRNKASSSAKQ